MELKTFSSVRSSCRSISPLILKAKTTGCWAATAKLIHVLSEFLCSRTRTLAVVPTEPVQRRTSARDPIPAR
eukprot:3456600-Heterocapsa_arctica.AAC.1